MSRLSPLTWVSLPSLSKRSKETTVKRTSVIEKIPAVTVTEQELPTPPSSVASIEDIPAQQTALLLHGARQPYVLTEQYPTPVALADDELIVRVLSIGLNPIDWKAPDYGFGIPELPYVSGRDFVGTVVKAQSPSSRFRPGDTVIGVSTDYRDLRKAAFQQLSVTAEHTACKLPETVTPNEGSSIGVAYVAAALGLGVCLGVDFSSSKGPDLVGLLRPYDRTQLPSDVAEECLNSISDEERPRPGDWVAVWGGSSTTAFFVSQLCKLAGLRVILVLDAAKHGARFPYYGGDLLIDSKNTERAIEIIRSVTGGALRFAIDTIGKETAGYLLDALAPATQEGQRKAHLVGLTGLPKAETQGVVYHSVPIKIFHEVRTVGQSLMVWLEELLSSGAIRTPDIAVAEGGLSGINSALDRMRKGEISGRRLVVPI